MNLYYKIIEDFKLQHYLKIVLEKSQSNGLPYHNLYHVLCMVRNVYNIGESCGVVKKELKRLVIAALFHDFNHSGGVKTDEENVKIAIEAFLEYSKQPQKENLEIISIIQATQYPYVIPEDKLTLHQKIIRDADLLQAFEDNHPQQLLIGLGVQEMGKTLRETISMQRNFINNNMKFHTSYASVSAWAEKNRILKELDFLENCLDKN